MIWEVFDLYKYAFFATIFGAWALGLQGLQSIPRRQGLEIFALSQWALVGNLVGKLVLGEDFQMGGLLFSLLFFLLGKVVLRKFPGPHTAQDAYYVSLQLFFLAIGYWLISYFPALESHMAVGFFGDIVTLLESEVLFIIVVMALAVSYNLLRFKKISVETFEMAIMGSSAQKSFLNEFIFGFILITSLYGLGLIFTLGFLLIPAILIGDSARSFKQSAIIICIGCSLSSLSGLIASMAYTRFSTVPSQIILLFLSLLIVRIVLNLRRSRSV